jgi:hypothetical protein
MNEAQPVRALLYGTMLRLRREGNGKRYSTVRIRYEVNQFSTKFQFTLRDIEEALESLKFTYPLTLEMEDNRLGWRLERIERHYKYNKPHIDLNE